MKKQYFVALSLLISSALCAQTITEANIPVIGDHVDISIVNTTNLDPGPSGMNQTWDFSSLVEDEAGFFDFVDPVGTDFGHHFPAANLCGISWEDSYAYYDVQSTVLNTAGFGLYVDGQTPPNDTALIVHNDLETVVELPFELNDNFSDSFDGSTTALSFIVQHSGILNITADGSGTLIIPSGTFTNVIRYHLNRTNTINGNDEVKDQYVWMSADHRFWLMLTEVNTILGTPTELTWFNSNPASVSVGVEELNIDGSIRLLNNAISNGEFLTLTSDHNLEATISIFDLTGKRVMDLGERRLNTNSHIAVSNLNTGMYLMQINVDGISVSKRFVVK